MSDHCKQCPAEGRCASCKLRHRVSQATRRAGMGDDARRAAEARRLARREARAVIDLATLGAEVDLWLLTDDGLLDSQAVSLAASGERPIMLTASERVAAAILIIERGGGVKEICLYLSLPYIISREDIECQTTSPQSSERSLPVSVV